MKVEAAKRKVRSGQSKPVVQKNLSQEIYGIVFLALAVLFAFSLGSYSPDDPSLDSAATETLKINNLLGVVGSHLAGVLIHLFGLSAFWFPILLLAASVYAFYGTLPTRPVYITMGLISLVISSAGLFALGPREFEIFDITYSSGGILGLFIANFLESYLNHFGALLILIVSFIIATIICTNISLKAFLNSLSFGLKALTDVTLKSIEKRKARKVKAQARMKHERKLSKEEAIIHDPPTTPEIKVEEKVEFKQKVLSFMADGDYELPSLKLLTDPPPRTSNIQRDSLIMNSRLLEKKLLDFGVEGNVSEVAPGPVVTMYEYKPAPGVKISKIAGLADDLALALRALSIRIVAPIPGKAAIGIEIPNNNREIVFLKEILGSEQFSEFQSPLAVALGKDIMGVPVVTDLARMPHLLIAGATGAGKSVALNAMILSILYKSVPDEVRLLMIDPKRIELSVYEGIQHLLHPVLMDPKEATLGLRWTVEEMERRYALLAKVGSRNINSYNNKIEKINKQNDDEEKLEPLPYIIVIIDELADLMMVSSKEVESSITRLAQMARAAGIHLILATQRPSVDVLTGIIKANLPVRISFQVSSRIDSRTILDSIGAEKLLGNGDMLFLPPGVSKLQRIHGAYVSDKEVRAVADFLKQQGTADYDKTILEVGRESDAVQAEEEYDEKYQEAIQVVTETGQASISMLQRRLRVGYNRAARMIEIMEKEGLVGPSDGVKPRQVLVNRL